MHLDPAIALQLTKTKGMVHNILLVDSPYENKIVSNRKT